MTSLKCKQCGLVNPFNVAKCKRCGFTLIVGANPAAPQSADQKAGEEIDKQSGIPKAGPPLSAVCSICGKSDGVQVRNLTRTYTPNWVWLFLPLGILPAAVIGLMVQVKHSLSLPICSRCAQRRSWAGAVSWLSIIVCIFLMFFAVGLGIFLKSWIVFLVISGFIATIAYLAGRYDRSVNPRYTQFTKERVEIHVPGRGRILVLDRANQQADQRR